MHNCTLNTKSSDMDECAPRRISNTRGVILHIYCTSTVSKHIPSLTETTPRLWKAKSLSKTTPPFGQNINEYMQRSSLFHLMDFECTTSPAPYIHTLFYMPPHNQISIWCQGGLRFGVFSFVNTTCRLLFTRLVTLAQAWNVILRWANLCTERIRACPPGKRAWIIYGHLSRRVCHTWDTSQTAAATRHTAG